MNFPKSSSRLQHVSSSSSSPSSSVLISAFVSNPSSVTIQNKRKVNTCSLSSRYSSFTWSSSQHNEVSLFTPRRGNNPFIHNTTSCCSQTTETTNSQSSSSSNTPISTGKLPIVAVVGRPNVGKSTLVNRLAGQFRSGSIVENVVGITRDRTYRRVEWNEHAFALVDTGGLVFDDQSTFLPEIRQQAMIAISEATVVILCVDGQAGLNPLDIELATFLRREFLTTQGRKGGENMEKFNKGNKDIFVAVNKCESSTNGIFMASEFWALGLGQPFAVSAIHGSGTGDLLDHVVANIPKIDIEEEDNIINVAIVGRPNVGKSSLLNALLNTNRAIVSSIPGTTRDAIDELVDFNGQTYRLIDTAGIRRKTNVNFGTEFFMINRAFRAIRRADVVLLLVDVNETSEQDRKIADRIKDEGKACVVVANKWDLIQEKTNKSYNSTIDKVRERSVSISWAPVELVSVIQRQRIMKIINMAQEAVEQHRRRISTAILNEVLREAVDWHKPPSTRQGKQGRIYYCTQVANSPPTIAMFVNDPKLFSDNYKRYMDGQFRKSLGFVGTPLRILWRGKSRAPNL